MGIGEEEQPLSNREVSNPRQGSGHDLRGEPRSPNDLREEVTATTSGDEQIRLRVIPIPLGQKMKGKAGSFGAFEIGLTAVNRNGPRARGLPQSGPTSMVIQPLEPLRDTTRPDHPLNMQRGVKPHHGHHGRTHHP